MTEVYAIKLLDQKDFERYDTALRRLLPRQDQDEVDRYRNPDDIQRSMLGKCLARKKLAEKIQDSPSMLNIRTSGKGKPFLKDVPNLFFSISHSGSWVIVGISDREIGIDVEKIREPQYRIAHRYFSSREVERLNALEEPVKSDYFFDLWTLKESYLKMLGKGLTQSLGSFTLVHVQDSYKLELNRNIHHDVHFYQFDLETGYKTSACTLSNDRVQAPQIVSFSELIEAGGTYES